MPVQLALTLPEMTRLDLTDEERADLVRELRDIVSNDRFPLSPRIRRLKRILDKLESPGQGAEPPPEPRREDNTAIPKSRVFHDISGASL